MASSVTGVSGVSSPSPVPQKDDDPMVSQKEAKVAQDTDKLREKEQSGDETPAVKTGDAISKAGMSVMGMNWIAGVIICAIGNIVEGIGYLANGNTGKGVAMLAGGHIGKGIAEGAEGESGGKVVGTMLAPVGGDQITKASEGDGQKNYTLADPPKQEQNQPPSGSGYSTAEGSAAYT